MKNLLDYIQGKRKGKRAYDLEREAMQNPFLQESLEGYDEIEGKHWENIIQMQKKILSKTQKKKRNTVSYFYVAASIFLIFSIGGYLLFQNKENKEVVYHSTKANEVNHSADQYLEKEIGIDSDISNKKEVLPVKEEKLEIKNETPLIAKSKTPKKTPEIHLDISHQIQSIPYAISNPEEHLAYESTLDKTAESKDIIIPDTALNEKVFSRIAIAKSEKKISDQIKDSKNQEESKSLSIAAPGIGITQYTQYLKDNLSLPKNDACEQVKGTALLQFTVNTKGRPQDIRVIQALCKTIDNQLIRLIEKGSDWTEGEGEIEFTW